MDKSITSENDGRELPGFNKKSFMMSFRGGEIWFEHLDGLYNHSLLVLEKLTSDAKTFSRPSMPSITAINLDETTVTDEIINMLAGLFAGSGKVFTRVVFVGVYGSDMRKIKKAFESASCALAFINDFEKAKEWVVGEDPGIHRHFRK